IRDRTVTGVQTCALPISKGERAGFGACTGDSGAPVFRDSGGRLAVIGVVSWSTGPNNSAGCGGLTGVTPLVRYRDWIVQTAAKRSEERRVGKEGRKRGRG